VTNAACAASVISAGDPEKMRVMLQTLVQRIEVHPEVIILELPREGIQSWRGGDGSADSTTAGHPEHAAGPIALRIDATLRRRGVEARFVLVGGSARRPDANLALLIARAHQCLALLTTGGLGSMNAVGEAVSLPASEVSRILPLAFLAPDIAQAILVGEQPVTLTAERLKRLPSLPLDWAEQRTLLGFSAPAAAASHPSV
jgi:site-specific DNA recombinase